MCLKVPHNYRKSTIYFLEQKKKASLNAVHVTCNKVYHVPQVYVVGGVTMEETEQWEYEKTLSKLDKMGS